MVTVVSKSKVNIVFLVEGVDDLSLTSLTVLTAQVSCRVSLSLSSSFHPSQPVPSGLLGLTRRRYLMTSALVVSIESGCYFP